MVDHQLIAKNGETAALADRIEALAFAEPDSLESHEAFDVHRRMLETLFIETFGFVLVVGVLIGTLQTMTTFLAVMLMGALGGFVSALRRLYGFEKIFPSDYVRWLKGNWSYLWLYSATPPLIGAMAAGVLYLVFASEMVSIIAVPKFASDKPIGNFMAFVNGLHFEESRDYAVALVWGFVAGFSERFVPDLMNQITNQKDHHTAKSKAGSFSNSVATRKA
jgi:hypothetical protein